MSANAILNSTEAIVLASGASATSKKVTCRGAFRVVIAVTADVAHQLTTGTVNLHMTDGKTVVIIPAALPAGADGTTVEVNVAGVIITADLSGAHKELIVRALSGGGAAGPYCMLPLIPGVDAVSLNLTKAATAGNATYTIITTPYWT